MNEAGDLPMLVDAKKITGVSAEGELGSIALAGDADPMQQTAEWMDSQRPYVGGYYATFSDSVAGFLPPSPWLDAL